MLNNRALHKKIWQLAWPMILANVATTLIGIVDTAILGHLPNPAFIGGAAIATSLFNILYMSLAFLRMGTTGLIAQEYGEKHWQNLYTTLLVSCCIALLIGIGLIVIKPYILKIFIPILGGSEQVQDMAFIYANIRILGSPFLLFNFVALGFLIGIQESKKALILLLVGQGINIFLDFYLTVYLHWDIKGIAWATVISDIAGFIIAAYFILSFLNTKKIHYSSVFNIKNKLYKAFSLNRDIFLRTIILISIFAFITSQSAIQGDITLAANTILIQLFFFLANAIDGFSNAAESRSGELIGEYKNKSIDSHFMLRKEINTSFYTATLQAVIFLSISLVLLNFFKVNLLTLICNQHMIIASAGNYFLWVSIIMLCSIISFIVDGVFIGSARGRTMLIVIVTSTVLVFFPSWYILREWGNNGLWFSLALFMLCRSVLSYYLYSRLDFTVLKSRRINS